MTLEERIGRLEDIEEVRQLQARYQRLLDTRDFEALSDCFTPDAVSSYGNGSMSYEGREAIIGFLRGALTVQIPSSHLIHGGEIEVDGDTAAAKWYLEDFLLHRRFLMKLHGAAIYDVRYRRTPEGWRISSIGYERCYEYMELRGPVNLLTLAKTTFLDAIKKKSE